jgi:hypothetical protein
MMGQRREAEKRQLEMVGGHDESGCETQLGIYRNGGLMVFLAKSCKAEKKARHQ